MSTRPKIRKIRTREDFDLLLDHLATEIDRAGDHWRLFRRLSDASKGIFSEAMYQTPQFWRLSVQAHQDSALLRLIRTYDPTEGTLSLYNFLQTLEHDLGNGDALSLNVPDIDVKRLRKDVQRLHEGRPQVKALLEIRNRYHIHREARLTSTGTFSSLPVLTFRAIGHLLKRARLTAKKYCLIYDRRVLTEGFAGDDDYLRMLETIKLSVDTHRADIEAQINRLRN